MPADTHPGWFETPPVDSSAAGQRQPDADDSPRQSHEYYDEPRISPPDDAGLVAFQAIERTQHRRAKLIEVFVTLICGVLGAAYVYAALALGGWPALAVSAGLLIIVGGIVLVWRS